jgi:DNA-directed RNA polymerase subunit RPC12/RpoP
MTYKCYDCGETFNEPKTVKEPHGEVLACCPYCNGSFDEAKKCEICGEYFFEDELNGGCVCDGCVEEYKQNFETCYAIAETTEKEEIKINALLASLVSVSKIEAVLCHILKEKGDVDCSVFINEDKDWFAEKLIEEVKK